MIKHIVKWYKEWIKAQYIKHNPDPTPVNMLSYQEWYALGLLAEECGETCQMVGKALRFGLHTPGRKGSNGEVDTSITPYTELSKECGDITAAIDFAVISGIIHVDTYIKQYRAKYNKLTNPDSKDNLGRPLAPQQFVSKLSNYTGR